MAAAACRIDVACFGSLSYDVLCSSTTTAAEARRGIVASFIAAQRCALELCTSFKRRDILPLACVQQSLEPGCCFVHVAAPKPAYLIAH